MISLRNSKILVLAILVLCATLSPALASQDDPTLDSIEFYSSSVLDDRIQVNSTGITRWRARWLETQEEITFGLDVTVLADNISLTLEYNEVTDYWESYDTRYNVCLVEYSILSASYGLINDWIQTADNVTIIWDRVVIYCVRPEGGNITSYEADKSPEIITYFISDAEVMIWVVSIVSIVFFSAAAFLVVRDAKRKRLVGKEMTKKE